VIRELLRNFNDNGIAYAIVCALSAWLGGLWAGRIARREAASLESQIAQLRDDIEREQKKLAGEIEKSIHVHRVQFEKEFAIYQEVMSSAEELRVAFFTLRRDLQPALDRPEDREKYFTPLREAFTKKFYVLQNAIYRNRPFFAPAVYQRCDKLLDLLTRELIHQDFFPLHGKDIPLTEVDRMKKETRVLVDGLSDSIRTRIQSVVVIE
jgi:hypothetical protein